MTAIPKLMIGTAMALALLFGLCHLFWPDAIISFKRLNIFLFNLCSGGSLILYYTDRVPIFSKKVRLYFFLSFLYALSAASRFYIPAILLSIPLLMIVESMRIRFFALFPYEFFQRSVPVSRKFHQASLLCLSSGLVIASLVMLNNEYLKIVSFNKLTLDVFFLGYSFPISLITMSVMFSFMTQNNDMAKAILKGAAFWLVNLGVILFFLFIIFESYMGEIGISTILFFTVCAIFYLFVRTTPEVQQRKLLISGMCFLLLSALTGILYILRYFTPTLEEYAKYVLSLHAIVALYGWNLSGLFIIIRWNDFPIKIHSYSLIALHWIVVLILLPLGQYSRSFNFVATVAYIAMLGLLFLSHGNKEVEAS
ncbi:MAG: hypothetical protein ABIK28_07095 [Planctomycetota bacterium]